MDEVAPYRDHVGEQAACENKPNIVGVRSGPGGGRSIRLNAHVDTVADGDASDWSCARSPGRSRETSFTGATRAT